MLSFVDRRSFVFGFLEDVRYWRCGDFGGFCVFGVDEFDVVVLFGGYEEVEGVEGVEYYEDYVEVVELVFV